MKSVLHEASSILKAIEKAWEASGKPSEFSVKILEEGERKFWFIANKPAIVSISFDQKHVAKQQFPSKGRKPHSNSQHSTSTQERLLNGGRQHPQTDTQVRGNRNNLKNDAHLEKNTKNQRPPQMHAKQPAPQQGFPAKPQQQVQTQKSQLQTEAFNAWTQEQSDFVAQELREILAIMQIVVPFSQKMDQKTLTITFETQPLENKEDARMLFISLSYLLIQATKKREKKKLRGFHLIVNAA